MKTRLSFLSALLTVLSLLLPLTAWADAPLADGLYRAEVRLSGGSGRAAIDSPAVLTVEDGKLYATIVWSSDHYTYMMCGGVRYDPVQKEGNSTFRLPVTLDEDIPVSAETTAMSQPHLIDYVLHFDGSTLTAAPSASHSTLPLILGAAAAAAVVIYLCTRARRRAAQQQGKAAR